MNQDVDNQAGGYEPTIMQKQCDAVGRVFIPAALGHPEADRAEYMRGYEAGMRDALASRPKVDEKSAAGDVREKFEKWYRTAILPTHDFRLPPKYTKEALEWSWQAALASQPKVTEAELVGVLMSVDDECRGFNYEQRHQWQATAILARFPWIKGE